jgi:hypothetical protein
LAFGAGLYGREFGRLLAEQAALPKRGSMQKNGDWLLKTLGGEEPGGICRNVSVLGFDRFIAPYGMPFFLLC